MVCPNCGGDMVGNGYTEPKHCEYADVPDYVEPDSGPYYCNYDPYDEAGHQG